MTTNEFKKEIRAAGFNVRCDSDDNIIQVKNYYGHIVAKVDTASQYSLCTMYNDLDKIDEARKLLLIRILSSYSATPVDEREEEKEYYLKFPEGFNDRCGEYSYLNQLRGNPNAFFVAGKADNDRYKAIFTDSDIAELPEKYKAGVACRFIERVEVE